MYVSPTLTTATLLTTGLSNVPTSTAFHINHCPSRPSRLSFVMPRSLRHPPIKTRGQNLISLNAVSGNSEMSEKGKDNNRITPRVMKPVHRLSVKCDHPCFMNADSPSPSFPEGDEVNERQTRNLMITGFNLFKSHLSEVPDIDKVIAAAKKMDPQENPSTSLPFTKTLKSREQTTNTKMLANHFHWPNVATEVPEHIFSQSRQLVIGDGFMMPGKSNGGLYRYNIETGETTRLLKPKKGWFYHKAEFMEFKGKTIMITVRTTKPWFFGKHKGELVWAEPPENPHQTGKLHNGINEGPYWTEHVIGEVADFLFEMDDLTGNGMPDIVVTEYKGQQLSLFSFKSVTDDGTPQWEKSILADGLGELFDLRIMDLNGNGKKDILFTNHVNDKRSGIFALEQTDKMAWRLHTLAQGIETRRPGKGEASPGNAVPFAPDKANPNQKPHVVVSGDGSGCAYLLIPNSQNEDDWEYQLVPLLDTGKAMIGQVIANDIDGDGIIEIGVPVYDWDSIEFFSYEPDTQAINDHEHDDKQSSDKDSNP